MLALVLWGTWFELWAAHTAASGSRQLLHFRHVRLGPIHEGLQQAHTTGPVDTSRVRKSSRHYHVESAAVTPHEKDYIYI